MEVTTDVSPEIINRSDKIDNPYKKSVKTLSKGFIEVLAPPLTETKKHLKELQETQAHLYDKLHSENLILSEVQHSDELHSMIDKIKVYNLKLQHIKKDIRTLHEKSIKLKKRALKLQDLKQAEEEIVNNPPR
ncbi:biogenesis of lysosomal organelles complex 1 subunit pallidin [Rhynchophorus ferrugineus]|uniref:Biogenesis of lysosome-related organelles complex 1 subunit 6 n=1 Tax=Rhynchophorus ferrugineus TaxID=354439 RepID=A0A834MIL5_RHYFE|nr:hypothetical protein GWI33_017400 [Rhynchophorus ferrugineus]